MISFSPFLLIGTKFAFFQRLENVFSNLQFLNMIESGFTKKKIFSKKKFLWKPHRAYGPC